MIVYGLDLILPIRTYPCIRIQLQKIWQHEYVYPVNELNEIKK